MAKQLGDMQILLDNTRHQLESAKIEVDKPFVKEAEENVEIAKVNSAVQDSKKTDIAPIFKEKSGTDERKVGGTVCGKERGETEHEMGEIVI